MTLYEVDDRMNNDSEIIEKIRDIVDGTIDHKDLFILNILEKAWWGHMIVESKNEYEKITKG